MLSRAIRTRASKCLLSSSRLPVLGTSGSKSGLSERHHNFPRYNSSSTNTPAHELESEDTSQESNEQSTSGRTLHKRRKLGIKPKLVPPILQGGPYNPDDLPSTGPDYPRDPPSVPSSEPTDEPDLNGYIIRVYDIPRLTPKSALRTMFRQFGRVHSMKYPMHENPDGSGRKGGSRTAYIVYWDKKGMENALNRWEEDGGPRLKNAKVKVKRLLDDLDDGREESRKSDEMEAKDKAEDEEMDVEEEVTKPRSLRTVPFPGSDSIGTRPSTESTSTPPLPRSGVPSIFGDNNLATKPSMQSAPTSGSDIPLKPKWSPSVPTTPWEVSLSTYKSSFVSEAISEYMITLNPSQHLKIYGAPTGWTSTDIGVWLSSTLR